MQTNERRGRVDQQGKTDQQVVRKDRGQGCSNTTPGHTTPLTFFSKLQFAVLCSRGRDTCLLIAPVFHQKETNSCGWKVTRHQTGRRGQMEGLTIGSPDHPPLLDWSITTTYLTWPPPTHLDWTKNNGKNTQRFNI